MQADLGPGDDDRIPVKHPRHAGDPLYTGHEDGKDWKIRREPAKEPRLVSLRRTHPARIASDAYRFLYALKAKRPGLSTRPFAFIAGEEA
ncbi:MAG: hypothetical protein WDZ84_03770 [Rhodovibrionaceae bacterium]